LYDDDNALSFMVFNATSRFQLYRGCLIIHVAGRLNTLNIHLGTDHLTCRLWFFVSFRIFFRTTRELEHLFFCRAKREIVFQTLTLAYMTKTLNQIFPPPKSEYFFQQHWESEYFFWKPPPGS
jgi:hypothetical protein